MELVSGGGSAEVAALRSSSGGAAGQFQPSDTEKEEGIDGRMFRKLD